jgi:hypothetical protein
LTLLPEIFSTVVIIHCVPPEKNRHDRGQSPENTYNSISWKQQDFNRISSRFFAFLRQEFFKNAGDPVDASKPKALEWAKRTANANRECVADGL